MPIYEILCRACGAETEVLVAKQGEPLPCPRCGSDDTGRLMSASSPRSGKSGQAYPNPKDTACCGSSPSQADCAGPGSCCGKRG